MKTPRFVIIAGPNGAGKTSAAGDLLRTLDIDEYVNADVIAQGFSMLQSETMAFTAGRLATQRLRQLIARHHSFAFETTLASRMITRLIAEAKAEGYHVTLIFLALSSTDMAKKRVARRVESGGHNVPNATITRRFYRGLRNFFHIYRQIVDDWHFYENDAELKLLAYYAGHTIVLDELLHTYEALAHE